MRESDVDGFWAVLGAVASEKKYLAMIKAPPLQKIREFVIDNIRDNHAQYVAEVGGEVIGWADAIPGARDATRHMASVGMGILEAYRGQGIGRRLLEQVIEHCWRARLVRIDLEVFVDNARAIALYEKLGFQTEGRLRKARLIDGEYKDVFHMAILHPSINEQAIDEPASDEPAAGGGDRG